MLNQILGKRSPTQKAKLRKLYNDLRQWAINTFLSYDAADLIGALRALGIANGDTLMVHGGFSNLSGYRGSPSSVIDALLEVVGPAGNLIMVSMPYLSSAYDYLKQGKSFDVRKTISHMGMVSETFRRRPGVQRSLNPVHPVLAFGSRAEWIVEGHEDCLYPCGRGSPFEKLAQLHAKFLFYDASIFTLTFFHYLEDLIQDRLAFPVYSDECLDVPVIDHAGQVRSVRTYVYAAAAIKRRRPDKMHRFMERAGQIHRARIGNSQLIVLHADDLVQVVDAMYRQGVVFYE